MPNPLAGHTPPTASRENLLCQTTAWVTKQIPAPPGFFKDRVVLCLHPLRALTTPQPQRLLDNSLSLAVLEAASLRSGQLQNQCPVSVRVLQNQCPVSTVLAKKGYLLTDLTWWSHEHFPRPITVLSSRPTFKAPPNIVSLETFQHMNLGETKYLVLS